MHELAQITTSIEAITPQLAKEYLDRNKANYRSLAPALVARYAEEMATGEWIEGTGSIDFATSGMLCDGQHRLAAVVASNRTQNFVVRRNVPPAVVERTDLGKKRTLGDILRARGEVNYNQLAGAAMLMARWERNAMVPGGCKAAPLSTALDVLDRRPGLRDACARSHQLRQAPLRMKSTVAACFIWAVSHVDAAEAPAFIQDLALGDGLRSVDPIHKLREAVIGRQLDRFAELALAIKAWNAWITGASITQLKWRRGGSMREPFPTLVDADNRSWEMPFPAECH